MFLTTLSSLLQATISCSEVTASQYFVPKLLGSVVAGYGNYTLACPTAPFGWNNQVGATGPHPYSRYVESYAGAFTINLSNLQGPTGSTIIAADGGIIGDDLLGDVTLGGQVWLP